MGKETVAILLIAGLHVAVVPVLLWALLDGDRVDLRGWWPRDEPPGEPPPAPDPPRGGGLPLADAEQAGVRLRTEHERLAARRRLQRRRHAPRTPDRVG